DGKNEYLLSKQASALERKTAARTAKLEKLIAEAESRKAALNEECAGEAATDYERLTEIGAEIEELDRKLSELYEEYETLI
ncbi:MAG: hypothetical protein J5940_05355, partial [Clostridia bacterium]|nr:hypothetical protein [Clostridia bacterium]